MFMKTYNVEEKNEQIYSTQMKAETRQARNTARNATHNTRQTRVRTKDATYKRQGRRRDARWNAQRHDENKR